MRDSDYNNKIAPIFRDKQVIEADDDDVDALTGHAQHAHRVVPALRPVVEKELVSGYEADAVNKSLQKHAGTESDLRPLEALLLRQIKERQIDGHKTEATEDDHRLHSKARANVGCDEGADDEADEIHLADRGNVGPAVTFHMPLSHPAFEGNFALFVLPLDRVAVITEVFRFALLLVRL